MKTAEIKLPDNWTEISRRICFDIARGKCEMCKLAHNTMHPTSRYVKIKLRAVPRNGVHEDVRDANLVCACQFCERNLIIASAVQLPVRLIKDSGIQGLLPIKDENKHSENDTRLKPLAELLGNKKRFKE